VIRAYFPYHKHPNTYAHTHVQIIAELKEGRPCQPTPPSASGLYKKRTVEADGARIDDAFDKIFYRAPATQVVLLLMFLCLLRYFSKQQRRQSDTVERNCPERSGSDMRGICYSIHRHNIARSRYLSLSLAPTHFLSLVLAYTHANTHIHRHALSHTHTPFFLFPSRCYVFSLSLSRLVPSLLATSPRSCSLSHILSFSVPLFLSSFSFLS